MDEQTKSDVVGIWFTNTNARVLRTNDNGELKEYMKVTLKKKTGYEKYSFIWPKEKVKTDRYHKNKRCIFTGADHMIKLRKYCISEEGKRTVEDEVSVTARKLSELMNM